MRLIPDFLILGAAKSGTTSLIKEMRNHPDVCAPGIEVNYFSQRFEKGADWYNSVFANKDKVLGEKSTSYLYETGCHQRIFDHNPGIKLIIILREPVKRAFSNWTMRFTQGRLLKQAHVFNSRNQQKIENIGFSHLFNYYISCNNGSVRHQEPLDIFERGLYIEQINHLMGIFPPDQLLVLIAERYFQQTSQELKRVSTFLKISDFPSGNHAWERKSEYPVKLDEKTATPIRDYYKPFNEKLFRFLGFEIPGWNI